MHERTNKRRGFSVTQRNEFLMESLKILEPDKAPDASHDHNFIVLS